MEKNPTTKLKRKSYGSGRYAFCRGCGRKRMVNSMFVGLWFDDCQNCREGGIGVNYLNY